MTSRWFWLLSLLTRKIWFRASLFCVAAVATALIAIVLSPYIPGDVPTKIGADAVDKILGIIASSMLAVTTFSLNIMVSAFSAATSNVTPRATKLVMEDSTTQNVLATFLGSFLYSLVGLIALSTGAYGDRGRVVLFVVTIGVIVLIVATLLKWIDHLSRLGRVTETTARVEKVAHDAMVARRDRPHMGGMPLRDPKAEIPPTARPVYSSSIGYVQHLDAGALSEIAEDGEGQIYVVVVPGKLVDPSEPIAFAQGLEIENQEQAIRDCFSIADVRSFDQDPRFGCCVLCEIASRALSPGINDPGTAIDVIGRAVRVLAVWAEPGDAEAGKVDYPRLHVPPIEPDDLFEDIFSGIARDGASVVEIGLRLQKAFRTLARLGDKRYAASAKRHSDIALERAEAALVIEDDKRRVREVAALV